MLRCTDMCLSPSASLTSQADADGDGVADELEEVHAAIWAHRNIYFRLFDYYASLGGDTIGSISVNEWTAFVDECHLANNKSKFCKRADLDRLFVAVDGVSSGGKKRDKALARAEFLQCLVRLAVLKYVQPKLMADVSEAFERLLCEDIEPRLEAVTLQHPNEFRETYCYKREVDQTLKRHEPTLRALFGAISRVGRTASLRSLGPLLTLGDWKQVWAQALAVHRAAMSQFCSSPLLSSDRCSSLTLPPPSPPSLPTPSQLMKCLGIIDADLTERECNLCFVASRMAVIDGETDRGKMKEAMVPFEGFCECLVRISVLKALPIAEELLQAASVMSTPCDDAGQFFHHMRANEPDKLKLFIEGNATAWGRSPRQPVQDCLHGLLCLMIRSIETMVSSEKGGKGFADDLRITGEEMLSWTEQYWQRKEEKMNTKID